MDNSKMFYNHFLKSVVAFSDDRYPRLHYPFQEGRMIPHVFLLVEGIFEDDPKPKKTLLCGPPSSLASVPCIITVQWG